jgi:hypothetical protein
MATTLWSDAAMQAALKIIFDRSLVNNVVYDSELLDLFEAGGDVQEERTTGGRYIETAQLFNLPAGVGARSEDDYIPVPSGPTIVNSRISLKKILGSVEMSADTMKKVRSQEGAFVDWAERALPSLVERLVNELDRMLIGYGAGIKARVNATTPATNLVVDSAYGLEVPATNPLEDHLLQFLAGETLIASPNSDGSTPRSGVMTVNAVDFANEYLVVNALATGLADDDYLFPGDAAGNSAAKEPMGLLGMVDDGTILATFQNIARGTYPQWKSFVQDCQGTPFASSQVLTEKVLTYADDEAYVRGGAKVDTLIVSRQGLRQVWADLLGDRTLNDPTSYTGGKSGINIWLGDRAVNLRAARKLPRTLAFGLTKSTFKRWMVHDWEWNDLTGSLWRQVTDATGRKDAFWAYGSMYLECSNSDPQKNFRIQNISDEVFGP